MKEHMSYQWQLQRAPRLRHSCQKHLIVPSNTALHTQQPHTMLRPSAPNCVHLRMLVTLHR